MKRYSSILLVILLFATSCCKDKNTWTPGEPDDPNSVGVYFDAENPGDLIIPADDMFEVNISLSRMVATNAVDVPLNLKCSHEGITIPNSVHFDAGQTSATIPVTYSAIPQKTKVSYNITVPDEYLFVYNDSRFNSFDGSILVSQWESANADGSPVTFYFTETNIINNPTVEPKPVTYSPIQCKMEVLPGAGKYRIHNFLGGEWDFEFTLQQSPFGKKKDLYRIMPYEKYQYLDEETYGEAYYHMWYLLTGDDTYYGTYYVKNLQGADTYFYYPCLYWYSVSNEKEFCAVRLAGTPDSEGVARNYCAASMWLYVTTANGDKIPDYFYVYFQWDNSAE